MTSAEKITILMEKLNYTQNGLARAAGVSQSGLFSILKGESSPKETTLHSIAQALHVKTADLLSDFEDPSSSVTAPGASPEGTSPERLIWIRNQRNLKQKDVADFLRIHRSTYTKYETGTSEPPIDCLCKLADYFNVSVDWLIGHDYSKSSGADPEEHLSSDEAKLIDIYRALTQEGKTMLLNQAELLISSPSLREKSISAAAR